MRYSKLLYIPFLLLTIACKAAKPGEPCEPPHGKFINTTVLNTCPGAMPADIPHFCFEFIFRDHGMVDVDNGFEKFRLPFKPAGDPCRFVIEGASLFGDMYFTLQGDSVLQLLDTAWTKLNTSSTFEKRYDKEGKELGFEHALNECVIAGEYALFIKGELSSHFVTIMANGQINGLKPYLGYALCYAGDCLEETDPPSRTIDLLDTRGNRETFAFKSVEGKMAIELYQLGDPIPDMKGGRSIGPMIYELRTE